MPSFHICDSIEEAQRKFAEGWIGDLIYSTRIQCKQQDKKELFFEWQ